MIRVMIVDDHPVVRDQVSTLLHATVGIELVGACSDGVHVIEAVASSQPQVVLMDVRMPQLDGISATRHLLAAYPEVRVVIFTASVSSKTVVDARKAGAVGYVMKNGDTRKLLEAIRTVAGGGTAWPDE